MFFIRNNSWTNYFLCKPHLFLTWLIFENDPAHGLRRNDEFFYTLFHPLFHCSLYTPVSLPVFELLLLFSLQAATSQDRRPLCLMSCFWTSTTPETGSQLPIRRCRSPARGRPSLETLCATTTTAASSMEHFLIPGVCLYLIFTEIINGLMD